MRGAYTAGMTDVLAKPLSRDEALMRLRVLEPSIRQMGVVSLYLFGSTARNEAQADSDVDLFGELDPDRRFGWDFFSLRGRIGDLLGQKVDFIERAALHPMLRDQIEASAVRVY